MSGKTVQQSQMELVLQMTQQDANLAGNVHGGVIMKRVDETAGIVGARHSGKQVVTASLDRLDFHKPVFVGDLLRLRASLNMVGKTSMEIGVRIEAENFVTGEVRHTASAYLTFVALDETGKPSKVPELVLESAEEKRRNLEAAKRREIRIGEKERERLRHSS